MDSIFVYKNQLVYNPSNLLFTIVQDSIRFERFKLLAIYMEGDYLGTYRIIEKNVFPVYKLSKMLSLLIFGSMLTLGTKALRTMRIKGRMSDNTKMALICLQFIEYQEKYT
ncbi:hypothetical protein AHMF7605_20805 [Adhaeribacter arboris]|uniref:Uncharacterized protein n=1 Tax=Adhaeribacter arboris TaxID=2072846 RepID=A0A2T2YJT7_9BACT|nr:hypothetical protein [Adhaeribacter arboris]PSR55768.1 hypothetical protein AHMF7605_20805 [Adhaeribacter arboris]